MTKKRKERDPLWLLNDYLRIWLTAAVLTPIWCFVALRIGCSFWVTLGPLVVVIAAMATVFLVSLWSADDEQ